MKHNQPWIYICLAAIILAGLSAWTEAKRISGAAQGGRPLFALLTGEAEVPGPGDPDGTGMAVITLNHGQGTVCFEIKVQDIEPAGAAHIHRGAEGEPGPVVVGLTGPGEDGVARGCVEDVDRDLIKEIMQHPERFYVNVHNAEFPPGAVRGQLSK